MQEQTGGLAAVRPGIPKRRPFAVLLLAACVLVLGGLATGYAMFDLFKNARTVYLEAELQGLQDLTQSLADAYDVYRQQAGPYLEQPYHTQSAISQVQLDVNTADPNVQKLVNLLKETSIVVDSMGDDKRRKTYTKVNLSVKDSSLIGMEAFADADKLGFGVPDIYGKYVVINWKDADSVNREYHLGLPKRMLSYNEIVDALKVDRDELQPILKEYAKLYADSVTDAQVTLNRDAEFVMGSTRLKSREITVTFTEAEFKQLVKKLADKLAADEKLQDLLYTRYKNAGTLLADSGYDVQPSEIKSKEAFVKSFRALVKAFADDVEGASLPGGVKMVLYVDRGDHILGRTITFHPGANETSTIRTGKWTEANGEQKGLFQYSRESGETVQEELSVSYTGGKKEKTETGALEITSRGADAGAPLHMTALWSVTADGPEKSGTLSLRAGTGENGTASGVNLDIRALKVKTDGDRRGGEFEVKLEWPNQPDPELPKAMSFKLKTDAEFGADVKLPDVSAANSINLATVTEQEISALQDEVQTGFRNFVQKHMDQFRELGIVP